MNVFYHPAEAKGKIYNAVVTTGSFDGVHMGHKLIIGRLNKIAKEIGGESVVITFYPHPRKVLCPDQENLKMINTIEEKIELLKKTGLHNLVIIPFSLKFSKTTSRDFVINILIGQMGARVIVAGRNHQFGYAREGDYAYLHRLSRELGFIVEDIPLKMIEDETVSSARIRKAIEEGNIMEANALLDHQYIIKGQLHEGTLINAVSANPLVEIQINPDEKLLPPPGIYASHLLADARWMKSMTTISKAQNGPPKIESLLIHDTLKPGSKKGTLHFFRRVWEKDPAVSGLMNESVLEQARTMVENMIY